MNGGTKLLQQRQVAWQLVADVSRIVDECSARQETNEEITGKIAHADSVSTLAIGSQHTGSDNPDPGMCLTVKIH